MKETLKALIAGFGCTPLLAVSLFIAGVALGQWVTVQLPPPPGWLILPVMLFPVCFGLYMRAVVVQAGSPPWLEQWRSHRRPKVVGHSDTPPPVSVEDAWLQSRLKQRAPHKAIKTLLDNQMLWGWASLITFLPLAHICLWYGLALAQR